MMTEKHSIYQKTISKKKEEKPTQPVSMSVFQSNACKTNLEQPNFDHEFKFKRSSTRRNDSPKYPFLLLIERCMLISIALFPNFQKTFETYFLKCKQKITPPFPVAPFFAKTILTNGKNEHFDSKLKKLVIEKRLRIQQQRNSKNTNPYWKRKTIPAS